MSGNVSFAIASMFSEKSIPVGTAPTFLTAPDTYPGPHATSRTDMPAEISALAIRNGMNWRVSDDHMVSYLSATRCQPSCSKRVNASSAVFMVRRELCCAGDNQHALRTAKRLKLLQRKFNRLCFFERHKFIALDDSRAGIPAQDRIIVTCRT